MRSICCNINLRLKTLQIENDLMKKKASHVNYEISKKLFYIIISKCNRALKLSKDLLAIDSTTITVGEGRLK